MTYEYVNGLDHEDQVLEYETEQHAPEEMTAVPVCIADPVVTVPVVPQHTSFRTVVLTSDDPVRQILPLDPLRVSATVISPDNDAVLAGSKSQASDKANLSDTTLARPNGTLLPKALTAGMPISSTDAVWVAAATYPSRISVLITRRTT